MTQDNRFMKKLYGAPQSHVVELQISSSMLLTSSGLQDGGGLDINENEEVEGVMSNEKEMGDNYWE